MMVYNFDRKRFALLQNSESGQVSSQTVFDYRQEGELVTADYFGGSVRYGKIIAKLNGDQLEMLYQCMTKDRELKAGKATAAVSKSADGKIKLLLDWQWITGGQEQGQSEYIELD